MKLMEQYLSPNFLQWELYYGDYEGVVFCFVSLSAFFEPYTDNWRVLPTFAQKEYT